MDSSSVSPASAAADPVAAVVFFFAAAFALTCVRREDENLVYAFLSVQASSTTNASCRQAHIAEEAMPRNE